MCEVQVNSSNDEPSRHESTLVAHKTLPACSAIVKLFIGLASEGVSVAMRAVKVVFISRYASLPPSDARSLRLLIRPRFGKRQGLKVNTHSLGDVCFCFRVKLHKTNFALICPMVR